MCQRDECEAAAAALVEFTERVQLWADTAPSGVDQQLWDYEQPGIAWFRCGDGGCRWLYWEAHRVWQPMGALLWSGSEAERAEAVSICHQIRALVGAWRAAAL